MVVCFAGACRQLRAAGDTTVVVDPCADPEGAKLLTTAALIVY